MAISNGLIPNVKAISLRNSTAIITGGRTTGSVAIAADILADVGVPGEGSVYISTNGTGEIWVKVSGVWTQLTIN